MSTTDKIPPGGYSNTDATTSSEGKERNTRSKNHNNIIRRNNKTGDTSLVDFTGEVMSVVTVIGTVTEQSSTKDQFKIFQYKVKNMYYVS